MLKKLLTYGGFVFLVFFIAFSPRSAMALVKTILNTLLTVSKGLVDIVF